jgi:hypothetical protein
MTGYAGARNGSNKIVLVSPAELLELARMTGQAMTLHTTADGRTLLYVEQNDGARLAIFDVTDPASLVESYCVGRGLVSASGPHALVATARLHSCDN